MATTNLNFQASVNDWVRATEARMTAVFRESAQRTISIAQSYVPVDTGFLRASVRASIEAMPPIDPKAAPSSKGARYGYSGSDVTLAIAGAGIGDTIYAGWTAAYAAYVEYGTAHMAPRAFVGRAAQRWQSTVNEVAVEARSRAGRA